MLANETSEVKAFYSLNKGALKQCIKSKVIRPCDSDWVTCIDDAWVVKYFVSEKCVSPQNEQLGVTLLVDGKSGENISKYPEVDYFRNPRFCRDSQDCLNSSMNKNQPEICKNFIYAFVENAAAKVDGCLCREARCELAP